MDLSNQLHIYEYLDIVRKYKWYGLTAAIVGMVGTILAGSFLPKVYESQCVVEVERGNIENPLKKGRTRPSTLSEQIGIFSENASRWAILFRVVDEVGPEKILKNGDIYGLNKFMTGLRPRKKSTPTLRDTQAQKEAVARLLKKDIKFQQKTPRFIMLSYKGIRPDVNASVLNTLVSALIEENMKAELHEAGRSLEFIEAELETYKQKLEEAEGLLKEFKEQHISELPNNMNINLTQLTKDKSELVTCELEIKELITRVNYIDKQLKNQNELIVSEIKSETNPMLRVLNEKIVDMEVELTSLRTNYTDLHPRIIELTGQLEDLKKQRDKLEKSPMNTETSMLNPVHQQLVQDKQNTMVRIEVLRNRFANLEKRIEENELKVRSMPAQEQQLLTLTRNYDVTAKIYNMFLQKLEEVRLEGKLATEEEDKQFFKVLEYARASLMPVSPNRLRVLAVAVIVSAMAGIGIMWLLDAFDDSIMNIDEAKKVLDRPFLGAVPHLSSIGEKNSPGARKKSVELSNKY